MRQNTNPTPEIKEFQSYLSYAGGHNSEISNERLRDDEFVVMQNVDLSSRDSAKRRGGRNQLYNITIPYRVFGHFMYHRTGVQEPTHILAFNNRIYLYNINGYIPIKIVDGTNIDWTYKTPNDDIMLEAVQYGDTLFIATGTKLVEVTSSSFADFVAGATYVLNEVVVYNGRYYKCTTAGVASDNFVQTGAFTFTNGATAWTMLDYTTVWTAKTVTPYTPSSQEVLYIGTNSLATDPNSYVQDAITSTLSVSGIVAQYRYGVINTDMNFNVYVGKPNSMAHIDVMWETKPSSLGGAVSGSYETATVVFNNNATADGSITLTIGGSSATYSALSAVTKETIAGFFRTANGFDGWTRTGTGATVIFTADTVGSKADASVLTGLTGVTVTVTTNAQGSGVNNWTVVKGWTSDTNGGKSLKTQFTATDLYDIKVTVRDSSNKNTTATYTLSSYKVEATMNPENLVPVNTTGIQTCTRIRLHWDRLLLFGGSKNPFLMYISDLKNPRYFPTNNVLSFDTGKLEPINAVLRFQDYLVVMTTTTVQTLVGKDPASYARYLIHDTIGCIVGRTASVVGNKVMFLSYDGIMALSPNPYRVEIMSVKRSDTQIHSEVVSKVDDKNACSMYHDNQYWVCFPASNVIYRYYHEYGVWVKDTSSKLDITNFIPYGGRVYNTTKLHGVLEHRDDTWADLDDVYTMEVDSKMYDLGYSFNYKKLRKMFLLARHFSTNTELYVKVYSDSDVILTPEHGEVQVINGGADTVWVSTTTPNMHFYAGSRVGSWILGKNPLGDIQISVQQASIQGKCRRIRYNVQHKENTPCEIFGVGFEFKKKKV